MGTLFTALGVLFTVGVLTDYVLQKLLGKC